MTPFFRKLLRFHWALLFLTVVLAVAGVALVYSATYMRSGSYEYLSLIWKKQAQWVVLGFIAMIGASLVDYRWIRRYGGAIVIFLSGLVLLVVTRLIGNEVYGAKSWLVLGPINFQPSQVAILGGIMVLAVFLSENDSWPAEFRILASGAIIGGPILLILIQPDLGSALVWIPVYLFILFAAGIPKRHLLAMLLVGVGIVTPILIPFALKPHQLARLTTFIDPEADPLGEGWAINQALIAIGSGGFEGKGFLAENTQNHLGFVPITAVHNDFIFTVLAEEHGYRGGIALIIAFALLLVFCLQIAGSARDDMGTLFATGFTGLLFTHIFLNIGMVMSIVPITGLPLPLISYGGSFAVLIMFGLGMLQSIWIHRKEAEE